MVKSVWRVALTPTTVNAAVPLVRPDAEAVIVAVPVVEAVKLAVATPLVGVTLAAGLKEPVTAVAEKVIALVADATVLPLAS